MLGRSTKDTTFVITKEAIVWLACSKPVPVNEGKWRANFVILIKTLFRARCIEQDAEEANREKTSMSGAKARKQEFSKWKKSRRSQGEEKKKKNKQRKQLELRRT